MHCKCNLFEGGYISWQKAHFGPKLPNAGENCAPVMNLPLCYILDLHSNHGGLAIVIVTVIHHIYFQFHCHDHQPWAHCRSLSGCRRPPRRPCPASSPSSPPCSPWTTTSSDWGQNRECKGQNHELRIRVVKNSLNNILWLNHVICHKTLAKWKCRIKRWR